MLAKLPVRHPNHASIYIFDIQNAKTRLHLL